MNLYFITGNSGKFEEIRALIPEVKQLDIDLPELKLIINGKRDNLLLTIINE